MSLLATHLVASRILLLRSQQVLPDADLAELYGVETRALNQAVRRNGESFPADFRFQLTAAEKPEVITNCDHLARLKYSPTQPYAFTKHGALLLDDVPPIAPSASPPTSIQNR